MDLNLELVGVRTESREFSYDWRDVALYALGVGATIEGELDLLYERRGPRVLPTFAVLPAFSTLQAIVAQLGHDPRALVHGEQALRLHQPLPASGTTSTTGVVSAIYDKGKGALVVIEANTVGEDGAPVADNVFSLYIRGAGGFGGERGPSGAPLAASPEARSRPPAFEVRCTTSPEQAALYRLCGDRNPIHIDPEIAALAGFERPILHGLCTYGIAGRVALEHACGGDPGRWKSLQARFSGVVFPGDTLIIRGHLLEASEDGGSRHALEVVTTDGRQVLSGGIVEARPS